MGGESELISFLTDLRDYDTGTITPCYINLLTNDGFKILAKRNIGTIRSSVLGKG